MCECERSFAELAQLCKKVEVQISLRNTWLIKARWCSGVEFSYVIEDERLSEAVLLMTSHIKGIGEKRVS